jgi:hypothetical protein
LLVVPMWRIGHVAEPPKLYGPHAPSLPLRPLAAAHESHITWIVCRVSSENPNHPRFTTHTVSTKELLQHYTFDIKYLTSECGII